MGVCCPCETRFVLLYAKLFLSIQYYLLANPDALHNCIHSEVHVLWKTFWYSSGLVPSYCQGARPLSPSAMQRATCMVYLAHPHTTLLLCRHQLGHAIQPGAHISQIVKQALSSLKFILTCSWVELLSC